MSTNGVNWEQRTSGLSGLGLPCTVVAHNGTAFILRPLAKVHRTTNQGQTWTALNSHPGTAAGYLYYHRGRLLFQAQGSITPEDGVYYSDDMGNTWNFNTGLKGDSIDITGDGNLLFASGYFGYLGTDGFKFSATDGLTWDRLPTNGLPSSFLASRIVRQGNYLFTHMPQNQKLYRLNLTGMDFTPSTQIARQPAATINRLAGQPLTVDVLAGGSHLTYQWRRNGVDLTGATNAVYSVAAATTNDSGAYTVVVSGARGVVTSAVANVTVVLREEGRTDVTYPSLNVGGQLQILPNGELLVFNNNRFYRYNSEGVLITNRTVNGVTTFSGLTLLDSSNRVLLVSGSPSRLWRINSETLANDHGFNQMTANSTIRTVVEWPGRGYLVGGDFTTVTNAGIATNAVPYMVLINYAGVVDTSFPGTNAPDASVYSIVLDGSTNIYVMGTFTRWGNEFLFSPYNYLVKVGTNGVRDVNFNRPNVLASANAFLRLLAPGHVLGLPAGAGAAPVVFLPDGSLDSTFNRSNLTFGGSGGGRWFVPWQLAKATNCTWRVLSIVMAVRLSRGTSDFCPMDNQTPLFTRAPAPVTSPAWLMTHGAICITPPAPAGPSDCSPVSRPLPHRRDMPSGWPNLAWRKIFNLPGPMLMGTAFRIFLNFTLAATLAMRSRAASLRWSKFWSKGRSIPRSPLCAKKV